MEKPFSLKIEDTKNELVNVINNAKIPAFCIKVILNEIMNYVCEIDNNEIENYKKELEKKEVHNNGI